MKEFVIIAGALLVGFASNVTVSLYYGKFGVKDFHHGQVVGMMLICIGLLV